jgi:hypothetical protein
MKYNFVNPKSRRVQIPRSMFKSHAPRPSRSTILCLHYTIPDLNSNIVIFIDRLPISSLLARDYSEATLGKGRALAFPTPAGP